MSGTVGRFRRYSAKDPSKGQMELILMAAPIAEEYEAKGYAMTLRQLYYQLVARGKIANVVENYNRLGDAVSEGRMAGMISWTAIEDRVRFLRGLDHFADPGEAVKSAREGFRLDLWKDQPMRPEVWIEKDALLGVIGDVCQDLRVNYFSCKGYSSQSELWRAGQRFARYVQQGQRPIVFYMGDHDPSGLNMVEVNRRKLELFAGVPIHVVPVAITMPQIEKYDPPPNPVKQSDSRTAGYVEEHGIETCWELDALSPDVMAEVIRSSIARVRDPALWDAALRREADGKDELDLIVERMEE